MKFYEYIENGVDEYGQATLQKGEEFEMDIYPQTRNKVDDVRFCESTDIGLTRYRTSAPILSSSLGGGANEARFAVLYVIPSKRMNTYILKKL